MPQLDTVLYVPLLGATLGFGTLLLCFTTEALLLHCLTLRSRRLRQIYCLSTNRNYGEKAPGFGRTPLYLAKQNLPRETADPAAVRQAETLWRNLLQRCCLPYDTQADRSGGLLPKGSTLSGQLRAFFRVLGTSDHKTIGRLYLIFGFFAALVGSIFSLIIRGQLAYPGSVLLGEHYQLYNVLVTMHAVLMIFMFVMPVLIGGFGNFVLPLQLGLPDVAFPRVNALSFWMLPSSLGLMYLSLLEKLGPGSG